MREFVHEDVPEFVIRETLKNTVRQQEPLSPQPANGRTLHCLCFNHRDSVRNAERAGALADQLTNPFVRDWCVSGKT
jgi:hypothetical protein